MEIVRCASEIPGHDGSTVLCDAESRAAFVRSRLDQDSNDLVVCEQRQRRAKPESGCAKRLLRIVPNVRRRIAWVDAVSAAPLPGGMVLTMGTVPRARHLRTISVSARRYSFAFPSARSLETMSGLAWVTESG